MYLFRTCFRGPWGGGGSSNPLTLTGDCSMGGPPLFLGGSFWRGSPWYLLLRVQTGGQHIPSPWPSWTGAYSLHLAASPPPLFFSIPSFALLSSATARRKRLGRSLSRWCLDPLSCSNDCIALCSTGPSQPSAICCESLRQRRLPSALL